MLATNTSEFNSEFEAPKFFLYVKLKDGYFVFGIDRDRKFDLTIVEIKDKKDGFEWEIKNP